MPFNKQGPFVDVPSTTKEGKQRLLSLGYPNAQVLTQEGWTNQSVQLQVSGQGNWTLRCAVFIDEARILMIGGYAGSDNSAWIVNTALPQMVATDAPKIDLSLSSISCARIRADHDSDDFHVIAVDGNAKVKYFDMKASLWKAARGKQRLTKITLRKRPSQL